MIIHTRAHARIGLIGNPSDGYYGKTISVTIENFAAVVTLWESDSLRIMPHPVHDPVEFDSLASLEATARRDGYYGGQRLIFATCKRFSEYCREQGIRLDDRVFTISYGTSIPRQVGLAGSSAIVTAATRALMRFYGVTEEQIPRPVMPNLVLSVETRELDIAAGLQDRVAQVYGGMVFMDFSRELMESRGHGEYLPMDSRLLPRLFLAYVEAPSDSGKAHSDVRFRFQQGDPEVVSAMRMFATFTEEAREALCDGDPDRLGRLMNANFDLRRRIFGDEVIGPQNLEMIRIARSLGFPGKFSGSGGAVIGLFRTDGDRECLRRAYEAAGYRFAEVRPAGSTAEGRALRQRPDQWEPGAVPLPARDRDPLGAAR